jgi:S-adenosylmethionine-dependent methyltransferase
MGEYVSSGFAAGEGPWRARLGTLRQVVRQELVARQLAAHLGEGTHRVLDVGCGQGTQSLRLARLGHRVTALDSSPTLLQDLAEALAEETQTIRDQVAIVQGDAERITDLFTPDSFDVVLCHGVLMYFPDPAPLLAALAEVRAPDGLLSLLVRNGDGLAMRPGLQGDWPSTRAAFTDLEYGNRIGVSARADRRADLTSALAGHGLEVDAWYGVRVFTDLASDDEPVPDENLLAEILDCEQRAGATDPYRSVAALTHLLARAGSSEVDIRYGVPR